MRLWCCRIERHSRTATGVTHLPEVLVQEPKEGTLVSSGAPQCRTLTNGLRSVDAQKKVVPSTEYGACLASFGHADCRCCPSARLPISLQAKSQQLFAIQPGIAPSNNITACSHPRKPATEGAHGDMESFPLAPSARSMSAIQAYGTCGYPESGHSHSLHFMRPSAHPLLSNIDRPLLPLDRDDSQQHGRQLGAAPLAAVRYHMIITNRSKQALDPDKYRRWPTSRPSNYFQC